jgi:anti-anti-sigma regulatory factor
MSRYALTPRGKPLSERPTYQWEPAKDSSALLLRLFGVLGRRELLRVPEVVRERCRSPRDLVCISFEDVEHLDFRALGEFTAALERQRYRGASIWFFGLSPYLRALFQVAGQEPSLNRLLWQKEETEAVFPALDESVPCPTAGLEDSDERWVRMEV